jgi:hypothetical protein
VEETNDGEETDGRKSVTHLKFCNLISILIVLTKWTLNGDPSGHGC